MLQKSIGKGRPRYFAPVGAAIYHDLHLKFARWR